MPDIFARYRIRADKCKKLTVRKTASINSAAICTLDAGQTVQVALGKQKTVTEISKSSGQSVTITWYQIKSNENRYWMSAAYLELVDPAALVCDVAKAVGDYMVANKYHYHVHGESSSATFPLSVTQKRKNATCTRFCSWVYQICGFLPPEKLISHSMGNSQYFIDCKIARTGGKTFKQLVSEGKIKPGDFLVGADGSCGNNYGSIYAGMIGGKHCWFEAGGPFKGTNTNKATPSVYTNIGPVYIPYDYTSKVEYIIRPAGNGNGGIDISAIV